jgi:hypothetical protein
MVQFIWQCIGLIIVHCPGLVNFLIKRSMKTPYTHIYGHDNPDELYMRRFWLFNPYSRETNMPKYKWFPWSIRIHNIMRADDDRDLHDHPWNARTIILRGGYIEELIRGDNVMVPGMTRKIEFEQYHRIDFVSSNDETWTLFISGSYQGVWGFLKDGVKIPWREYLGVEK